MAEAQLIFYLKRLESLILEEPETFTGLVHQIQSIIGSLKQAVDYVQQRANSKNDASFSALVNDLRDIVTEIDDHVDEFIIQIDKQIRPDRLALTESFSTELHKIESRLAETASTIEGLQKESKANTQQFHGQQQGHTSSVPLNIKYNNLPYYLQSCLLYCSIFPENYWIGKGKLIRLLVAEGLIQEKPGQILEDVAESNINELVNLGMLELKDKHPGNGTKLTVSPPYRMLLRENFTSTQANSDVNIPRTARRVLTSDLNKIGQALNNLLPHSLFLFGNQEKFKGTWLDLTWAKFLRELDLEDTHIKSLPDEVADLVHLTYLGLKHTDINELPIRLGKLRALQTLDIRWCGLPELSPEILNLTRLGHLKMFKNTNISGVKLPEGIGGLRNLLTFAKIYAGDGIPRELEKLTQLKMLGVIDVAEENASELYVSVSKMRHLLNLSLEAKYAFQKENLLLVEPFSPPPLLRKLCLEGSLKKCQLVWLNGKSYKAKACFLSFIQESNISSSAPA